MPRPCKFHQRFRLAGRGSRTLARRRGWSAESLLGPGRGNEKEGAPSERGRRSDGQKQWSFRRLFSDEARLRKRQSKDEVADGLRLLRDALPEHVVDDADAEPVLDIVMRTVVPRENVANVFSIAFANFHGCNVAQGVRRALQRVQRDGLSVELELKRHSVPLCGPTSDSPDSNAATERCKCNEHDRATLNRAALRRLRRLCGSNTQRRRRN